MVHGAEAIVHAAITLALTPNEAVEVAATVGSAPATAQADASRPMAPVQIFNGKPPPGLTSRRIRPNVIRAGLTNAEGATAPTPTERFRDPAVSVFKSRRLSAAG